MGGGRRQVFVRFRGKLTGGKAGADEKEFLFKEEKRK